MPPYRLDPDFGKGLPAALPPAPPSGLRRLDVGWPGSTSAFERGRTRIQVHVPRYSPRTHVFAYGPTAPKATRERLVLEEFCRRMRDWYCASYRPIPVNVALRRRLIVETGGATVDGVLRTSAGPVAVELLGYAPVGDRGDVLDRDRDLRKVVKTALFDRLLERQFSLSLTYLERQRVGREGTGTVLSVPRKNEFRALVRELRAIVRISPNIAANNFISFRFTAGDVDAHQRVLRAGCHWLDATEFPICASNATRVCLQGLDSGLMPHVNSNLNGGFVGLNRGWVTCQLHKKATKSLERSRERAGGLPLWLIVHSDGHAINRTIHETNRVNAVRHAQEVLSTTTHGFARAYWIDGTAFVNASWVGRIV